MKDLNLNFEKDFFGKKIIITGASRGLGAKTCEVLAAKGAKIVMLSRSIKDMDILKSKLKNSKNHKCIQVDFLKEDQIEIAIDKAHKFLKQIDIVLHIAGGGYGLSDPLIKNQDINKFCNLIKGVGAPT